MINVRRSKLKLGRVFGLDVSTKTGIVEIDVQGKVRSWELKLDSTSELQKRLARMDELDTRLHAVLNGDKPVALVAIEGYAMSAKFVRTEQVELAATARLTCYRLGIPMVEITPSTLKKFVSGKGNAQKNQMMLAVYKYWKFYPSSDNVADAYGLARIARCLTGQDKPTAFQAKVLAEIGKSKRGKKSELKFEKPVD